MAHYQQLEFVKKLSQFFPSFFSGKKVLEVGSWDVNGSIRENFSNCDYLGVDIAKGKGVDLVCKGEDISMSDEFFDTVISCECFEHNPQWGKTFSNMLRMLKPGGLCIVTCATLGRKEHGTPRTNPQHSLTSLYSSDNYYNYYANLKPSDFKKIKNFRMLFDKYYFFLNAYSRDLYFLGFKKNVLEKKKNKLTFFQKRSIKSIRKKNTVSLLERVRTHIRFYYKYIFALVRGEEKYHQGNLRLK